MNSLCRFGPSLAVTTIAVSLLLIGCAVAITEAPFVDATLSIKAALESSLLLFLFSVVAVSVVVAAVVVVVVFVSISALVLFAGS